MTLFMANSEEKVSKFVQAITKYAEEQREKILRETEALKAERLQKAEQEVLTDAYKLIRSETESIRSESVREMSRRDLDARKKVLTRRGEIMKDIFDRAEKKLLEFTATPGYTDYVGNMFKSMTAQFPAEGSVYFISKKDERLSDELSSVCPKGSRLEISDEIRIGGIRGVNKTSGQILDNTLDSKLQSQHDWFTISSGLTVG